MAVSSYIFKLMKQESHFILNLQNLVGENNILLTRITRMSDPGYAIAILFPVVASMNSVVGMEILLVSAVTEWLNTILKWILVEDRPYWWVKEARMNIPIRQTELTCETGPGSPSGHVMGATALLFVLAKWFYKWFTEDPQIRNWFSEKFIKRAIWTVFCILVILVSISRIIIGTHFPHQCVLGFVLGVLVAKATFRGGKPTLFAMFPLNTKFHMFMAGTAFSALSILAYCSIRFAGFDPGWSIKLAFKWCISPEYVSVFTTPVYSLVRDCGCMCGLALAWPVVDRKFHPIVGATVATLFYVSTRMLRPLMPTNDAFQFYTFHFLDHSFTCFCILTIVPYIASLVKAKEKKN